MKIHKRKPLSWRWEASGGSTPVTPLLPVSCRSVGEEATLQVEFSPLLSAWGKKDSRLLALWNSPANETWFHLSQWDAMILGTPSFLQWIFCLEQPLWPFPYKRASSPLLWQLAPGWTLACLARIAILHYSRTNLLLLVKITVLFLKLTVSLRVKRVCTYEKTQCYQKELNCDLRY